MDLSLTRVLFSSVSLAALAVAHPAPGKVENKIARDAVILPGNGTMPEPAPTTEVVVWVNKAGEPVCTITEAVPAMATWSPPPPPPVKIVEPEEECTTTTTMTSLSTSTVVVTIKPSPVIAVEIAQTDVPPSPAAAVAEGHHPASNYPPPPPPQSVPEGSHVPPAKGASGHKGGSSTKGVPPPVSEKLPGVSYSPYLANGDCKSLSDIQEDFAVFHGAYAMVRLYGTDCDQVSNVYAVAKPLGIKMFCGIFDINDVQNEANSIVSTMKNNWDMVNTVSVGNELVNSGEASPEQVIQAVNTARSILRAAGYTGPVVTVDTFIATEAHPELCQESDYCAINAHAFFDGTIAAPGSGSWLTGTVQRVRSAIGSPKRIVVTETGWPTKGVSNGAAVPGLSQQKAALDSIRSAFASNPQDLILFSAFNDLWKTAEMSTFDADQYWGINGATAPSDM